MEQRKSSPLYPAAGPQASLTVVPKLMSISATEHRQTDEHPTSNHKQIKEQTSNNTHDLTNKSIILEKRNLNTIKIVITDTNQTLKLEQKKIRILRSGCWS